MADSDIPSLNPQTTNLGTDITNVVKDPGGGGEEDVKTTIDDLLKGTFQFELPASAFKPTATTGAAGLTTREMGANNENVEVMEFIDGSDTKAWVRFRLPKAWDAGNIKYHYEWFRENDETTPESKTVEFEVSAIARPNFEQIGSTALPTGTAVVDTTDSTAAENKIMISDQSAGFAVGGTPTAGESIYMEIMRDDSAGTMTGSAFLVSVIIEYSTTKRDSIGA